MDNFIPTGRSAPNSSTTLPAHSQFLDTTGSHHATAETHHHYHYHYHSNLRGPRAESGLPPHVGATTPVYAHLSQSGPLHSRSGFGRERGSSGSDEDTIGLDTLFDSSASSSESGAESDTSSGSDREAYGRALVARAFISSRRIAYRAFLNAVIRLKQAEPGLSADLAWYKLGQRLIADGKFTDSGEVASAWEFAFQQCPSVHFDVLYAKSVPVLLDMLEA